MDFGLLPSIAFAQASPTQATVGAQTLTNVPPGLLEYMNMLFQTAFTFAGVLAFAMIAYSAVRYTLSAANPSIKEDAKEAIISALLGLLLLLGAFTILNVINPEIANINIPPLKPVRPVAVGTPGEGPIGGLPGDQVRNLLEGVASTSLPDSELAGLRRSVIDELISLKDACDCQITITSAVGQHTPGSCSHAMGVKVDIRSQGSGEALTRYIQNGSGGFVRDGTRSDPHGGPRYRRGNATYVLEDDPPHWDVAVGCGN